MAVKKILVVDDEPDVLKLIGIELEGEGYEVFSVATGQESIAKARQLIPDLILMDVMLPDMSGGEAVKAIKKEVLTTRIPIIFITALFSKKEEHQHSTLNVDDKQYLTIAKPFTSGELLLIKKTLEKEPPAGKRN